VLTVPSTHGIPKRRQLDAPTSGSNHAAAKGKQTQGCRVERSNRSEVVRRAAMQQKHDSLGLRILAGETQAGRKGHEIRLACDQTFGQIRDLAGSP
jgi:hypothetical protein